MSAKKKVPPYRRHARGTAYSKYRGKFYYFGKYGTDESRKRYRRFLEQIELTEDAAPIDPGSYSSRTVGRLIALYLEHCDTYYVDAAGERTAEYASMDATLVDVYTVMGEDLGSGVGPVHFQRLQQHLIKKGYCRTHINKVVGRAKRMFKWACANGLCAAEVFHRLACIEPLRRGRTKARESKKVKPVPQSVVDATLPWLSPVVADMVRTQYICGMRPSEVCRMRPCDIDRSGDVWLYRPAKHKNEWREHQRIVAIPKAAQIVLRPYLDREDDQWLFSPRASEKIRNDAKQAEAAGGERKTKRFPCEARRLAKEKLARRTTAFTRLRHCYDANSYRRAIDYAVKKAKRKGTTIPAWFPYQLRHGAATEVARVLGPLAAQRWLGHEHLDTTSIYVDQQVSDLVATARQLDDHWAKVAAAAKVEGKPQIASAAG